MMGYGWGMGGGWIAMTVFWVALMTLFIWLVTRVLADRDDRNDGGRRGFPPTESPEEVLDRRYATGELDLETYQRMRANLASGRSNGVGGPR